MRELAEASTRQYQGSMGALFLAIALSALAVALLCGWVLAYPGASARIEKAIWHAGDRSDGPVWSRERVRRFLRRQLAGMAILAVAANIVLFLREAGTGQVVLYELAEFLPVVIFAAGALRYFRRLYPPEGQRIR